jgi:hypothetical protein
MLSCLGATVLLELCTRGVYEFAPVERRSQAAHSLDTMQTVLGLEYQADLRLSLTVNRH